MPAHKPSGVLFEIATNPLANEIWRVIGAFHESFTGGDGLISQPELGFVHRFEPGTLRGAPALLLLPGSGGDESSLLPLGRAIAPGAALLSTRGNVLEHAMPRFFRLEDGAFDLEDLKFRTRELAEFIVNASLAYSLRRSRLVAVGFSNGANITSSILLRFPESFAGAILMRGAVPFVPDEPLDLKRKPVLILGGLEDPIVGTDQVNDLAKILRDANADVTLHWENIGHILSQGDVLMAFDWIRKFYETSKPQRAQ